MAASDEEIDADLGIGGGFGHRLSENYLVFAMSTLTARALPDVRDGLTPIQRRILWAIYTLSQHDRVPSLRSARVVGEVIGKYHPHGEQAVYEALIRLAQDFSARYPLLNGQGNFGSPNGDGPAAMRYTEAGLSGVARYLLAGIEEGAADFQPSWTGRGEEPVFLPGPFPNLLANGASGNGVGMVTAIPPHNLAELLEAAIHLVDNPDAETADLMAFIRGPDFPGGGILADSAASIAAAYASGKGRFRVRARMDRVEDERGSWYFLVRELPPEVQKDRLLGQIADRVADGRLAWLAEVRDESGDEKLRIMLMPASPAGDPASLAETLFRWTDLEREVALNINVLGEDRQPSQLGLKGVLATWIDHQLEVMMRRSRFDIDLLSREREDLEGQLVACRNVDQIIALGRERGDPWGMIAIQFSLSDRQAQMISAMPVHILHNLDAAAIESRLEDNGLELRALTRLTESPALRRSKLRTQFAELHIAYGPETPLGQRRTRIGHENSLEAPAEAGRPPKEAPPSPRAGDGWTKTGEERVSDEDYLAALLGDTLLEYQTARLGKVGAHLDFVKQAVAAATGPAHV